MPLAVRAAQSLLFPRDRLLASCSHCSFNPPYDLRLWQPTDNNPVFLVLRCFHFHWQVHPKEILRGHTLKHSHSAQISLTYLSLHCGDRINAWPIMTRRSLSPLPRLTCHLVFELRMVEKSMFHLFRKLSCGLIVPRRPEGRKSDQTIDIRLI